MKRTTSTLMGMICTLILLVTGSAFSAVSAQNNPAEISALRLVDVNTQESLRILGESTIFNLSEIVDSAVTVVATIEGDQKVGSVIFELTGTETRRQVENIAPYALFGDTSAGLNGWVAVTGWLHTDRHTLLRQEWRRYSR